MSANPKIANRSPSRPLKSLRSLLLAASLPGLLGATTGLAAVECVEPGDFFAGPTSAIPTVLLGPVQINEAKFPGGQGGALQVTECSGFPGLDVLIRWSEAGASPPATIWFSAASCDGGLPAEVSISFTLDSTPATWRAYDFGGALVDTAASPAVPGQQAVTLSSATGIRRVTVEGALVCIQRICWDCKPVEPVGGGCEAVGDHHEAKREGALVDSLQLGEIEVTPAVDASGEKLPFYVRDCNEDGAADLYIPSSPADASPQVTVHMNDTCGPDQVPVVVIVTLLTDYARVHAYDASGIEVDTVVASPVYGMQALMVQSLGGIATVGIETKESCLVSVCWRCGPGIAVARPVFKRGDANQDLTVDVSDAIFQLNFLFSGGSRPPCLDAADANDDGRNDISDASAILGYLFSGARPLPGGPRCAEDETEDRLDCERPICETLLR